ncbi:MAG TPA: hypothetical protein VEQ11_21770 [Chloroflexota bacterium]|nr:hypothetical protein [Chloroflexota bacterium]
MRTPLLFLALILAVGAFPTFVEASIPRDPAVQLTSFASHPERVAKKSRHKKKHKSHSSSGGSVSVSLDSIDSVRRGRSVDINGHVGSSNVTCFLKVTYTDGTKDEPGSKSPNSDKDCKFTISVPDNRDVVGDATAELTAKDDSGHKKGSDKRTFSVTDR